MRRQCLVAGGLALFISCAPAIQVNSADPTAPSVSVLLVSAAELNAEFTDDPLGPVSAEVTGHPFSVAPRWDSRRVGFLFDATDHESGISALTATLDVTFICSAVEEEVGTGRFSTTANHRGPSLAHGESTLPQRVVGAGFTVEDLWRSGPCYARGAREGIIFGMRGNYSVTATNNSAPHLTAGPVTGRFTVDDMPVSLSSP